MRKYQVFSRGEHIVFLVLLLSVSPSAFAYLDPGTGSMILQGIVAALFGSMFFLKRSWYRIRGYFSSNTPETSVSKGSDQSSSKAQH